MADNLTSRMMIAPSRRANQDDQGLNAMRAKLLMQQAASQPTYIQPGEPPAKAWAPVVAQLGSILAGKAATKQENAKQKQLADMLTGLVEGKQVPGQMPEGQMGPGAIERVPYTENEKLAQLVQNPATQDIALKRMFPEVSKPGDMPATVQQTLWYSKQTPEMQATFDRLQRAQQVLNLGGTQAVLSPTGGIQQSFPVTPKPNEMPEFQGRQEAAKKSASAGIDEETKKLAKSTDANDVLTIMDMAEKYIDKSTGSIAGNVRDTVAGSVGVSTEGAKAAAQLKVLSGTLVSKMPKMSGPQSDKDVLLYKEMAGQIGDPTIPGETKKAAMQTIKALNQKYVDKNTGPSQKPQSQVVEVDW